MHLFVLNGYLERCFTDYSRKVTEMVLEALHGKHRAETKGYFLQVVVFAKACMFLSGDLGEGFGIAGK